MNQLEWNQDCCDCQGEAQLEVDGNGQEACVGCDQMGQPAGYDYCSSPQYGGFGNFVVDFFSPDVIRALGDTISGRSSSAGNYTPRQRDESMKTGLAVVIGAVVLSLGILIYTLRKKKK